MNQQTYHQKKIDKKPNRKEESKNGTNLKKKKRKKKLRKLSTSERENQPHGKLCFVTANIHIHWKKYREREQDLGCDTCDILVMLKMNLFQFQ